MSIHTDNIVLIALLCRRGHASEKPALPAILSERGIRFLGPPAAAMAALGDKVGSTILAQAAGVPTLPWSGTGVLVDYQTCNGDIPEQVYAAACVHSVEEALTSCAQIGYPVMLKVRPSPPRCFYHVHISITLPSHLFHMIGVQVAGSIQRLTRHATPVVFSSKPAWYYQWNCAAQSAAIDEG